MKKILLTTAIVLSTASIGVSAELNPNSHNWNSIVSDSPAIIVADRTAIAYKYNRNNSKSVADMQKISNNNSSNGYDSVLATAKAEQKKAQKAGFEWTTIRKLIKAAKKDQKAGNESAAIKKLNTATLHAKLGQQQAIDQKNAGPRF
jgi:hypothetical protein